jgi:imidazole glycerol-phosphate synthase subunit HisH
VTRVGVVDYDLGNLPSVTKALERVGAMPVLITRASGFGDDLDAIVVPGVGHFGAGARNLADRGYVEPLKAWAADGRPLLGICVGLQLFCERSEEDPEARGLGIIDASVRRVHAPKVPHMGWNTVEVSADARVLSAVGPDEMVYFVHSYAVDANPAITAGTTTYGDRFASGVEQGNVVGVQFHPEKSAGVGRRLLARFLEVVAGAEARSA